MNNLDFSTRGQSLIGQKMFSILDQANEYEKKGRLIKHLELGEPDQYAPGRIINKTVISLLGHKLGYAPSGGLSSFREGIARFFSNYYGIHIDEKNVVISPANLLIYQVLEITCNESDKVCIFTPGFPTYFAASQYIGLDINEIPLDCSDGFQLGIEHIDQAIAIRPKVIIVNSGNNPTGAVYTESALRYLVEKAAEKNIWLISDETYGMLSFKKPYFSLSCLSYKKIVVISSFSKVFCVAGYRVGYAIGDVHMVQKIVLSSSTLYSCLPIFVQEGVAEVKRDVLTGQELSTLFGRNKLFPQELSQLMAVGERTGQLDEMLISIANFYEEEFDNTVATLSAAIEPIMIVLVGGIVAALLLGMYLPIFSAGELFAG